MAEEATTPPARHRDGSGRTRGRVRGEARPWRWLASTVALQREAYGHDWEVIGRTVPNQVASIRDNLLAAAVELLGEVPREFSWKYWARDRPFVRRARLIAELVDVAHFIANILVALDVTDDEWEAAYKAKQAVNYDRQAEGYLADKKEERT